MTLQSEGQAPFEILSASTSSALLEVRGIEPGFTPGQQAVDLRPVQDCTLLATAMPQIPLTDLGL